MSYGIVRVQKFGLGSVKGIEIHDLRQKVGVSHTNDDINWQKSIDNYDIHYSNNRNFKLTIKNRINQLNLKRAVRKDAVVMAQVLVTSDSSFFQSISHDKQQQFFKDSYDFLAERYGKHNIISAVVHLDELTPHMHFNFIPITDDDRLSAKSILTKQSLIQQQTAFFESVGRKYGLERGLQGGKKSHYQTSEFKAKTSFEHIQQQLNDSQDTLANYEALQAILLDEIEDLERQRKSIQLAVNNAQATLNKLNGQVLNLSQISDIKGKKSITGALKDVSYQEYLSLKKTASLDRKSVV